METEAKLKEPEPLCDYVDRGDAVESDHVSQADGENNSTQDPTVSNGDDTDDGKEMVDLKIIWNKNKYDLKIPLDGTGAKLKERIHSLTGKSKIS